MNKITITEDYLNHLVKKAVEDMILEQKVVKSNVSALNEASVDRILSHGIEGFIIVSANLSEFTKELREDMEEEIGPNPSKEQEEEWLYRRNKRCDKELLHDIQDKGYTYTKTFGGYNNPDEGIVDSYEPSYVVYNHKHNSDDSDFDELVDFAKYVCGKYHQHSVYVKPQGNEPPVYIDKDGYKVNKKSSNDIKINRKKEMFFTTNKRDKNNPQRFTADIEFPEEDDSYTPEKIFEGMSVCSRVDRVNRMMRKAKGEIFVM